MLTSDHLVHHYAKHENGMPKCGGPKTEFCSAEKTITRPNTTSNTETVCQNVEDPKQGSVMLPNDDLIQHYTKQENGMRKCGGPKAELCDAHRRSPGTPLCQTRERYAKMRRTQNRVQRC
jgi:ribosomal protein L34E